MSEVTKVNLEHLRKDFPMLSKTMHEKPLVYFDTAATAQKPQCVIDAITDFYTNHYGTVHRAVYELSSTATEQYQQVREKVRQFLNAKSTHEIIFTRGTTESINMVAYSFGKVFIQPGDEVVITEMEHHSNIVPWQIMCQDRGAVLKVIPINNRGELDLEAYRNILNEKTKIVSLCHISNSLGTVNPVETVIQWAHDVGAKVLIDGAQAAPHFPIDVQALDADFYAFSGHKTYGPTGIGVLYGKESLLDLMPPYQGGGDMIETVTFEKTTYNALPMKFEAGTPLIAEVIGLGAAIDYLEKIGKKNIEFWEQDLLHLATNLLRKIEGIHIIGTSTRKGAIISFSVEGVHHLDIGTLMDLNGIAVRTGHHCTQPVMEHFNIPGTTRASFGLYNRPKEIEYFVEVLRKIIHQLRS